MEQYKYTEAVLSHQKAVLAGDVLTVMAFENPFKVSGDWPREPDPSSKPPVVPLTPEEVRLKALRRAKKEVHDLVNANSYRYKKLDGRVEQVVFMTLTQSENMRDVKVSNKHFNLFTKRLNRYLGFNAAYVAALEFQQRGSVHFHILLFNLPYVSQRRLMSFWKRGSVNIKMVRRGSNNAWYLTKYIEKNFSDPRLRGLKCYQSSKGLFRAFKCSVQHIVSECVSGIERFGYYLSKRTAEFNSGFLGQTKLIQYVLKPTPEAQFWVQEKLFSSLAE